MKTSDPVPSGTPKISKNTGNSQPPPVPQLKSAPTEGGDVLRTCWYQSEYRLTLTPSDCEVTDLWEALCRLQQDWRRDKGVYSVEVMLSIGEVIRCVEEVMDNGTTS